jgi:hypothetical protein
VLVTLVVLSAITVAPAKKDTKQRSIGAAALANAAELPMYFTENQGQIDAPVAYYVEGSPTDLYFGAKGITMEYDTQARQGEERATATTLISFVGANDISPVAVGENGPQFSYFIGPRENWHAGVDSTTSLIYRNLWDGIDLVLEGSGGNLKYTFEVATNADPSQIAFTYEGASLKVDGNGDLLITNPLATIVDKRPVADQGEGVLVDIAYDLVTSDDGGTVGFVLGEYDLRKPLTIDPIVLSWANLIGSPSYDSAGAIDVDETGVYAGGYACDEITSFDGGTPGYNTTINTPCDGYLFKLDLDGLGVQYATYIGGSGGSDGIEGLAVDDDRNAYVLTYTDSTDYPTTSGVVDDDFNGGAADAGLTKVNAAGTGLEYSTYVGGSGEEYGTEVAVDGSGQLYFVGRTSSADLPTTGGGDLSANGSTDVFVGRLNATATAFGYLGYIGGSLSEGSDKQDIIIDGSGNAFVHSITASTAATFPETPGAFDVLFGTTGANGGVSDAFIAKLDTTGAATAVTYLGGTAEDTDGSMVLANGSLYVVGSTASTQATGFPAVTGPDTTHNGSFDAYLARFNTGLTAVTTSGFFGGTADDRGVSIDTDVNGDIYIAGSTNSTQAQGFPLKDGPDLTHNGSRDAFVAKITAATLATEFSGYLGGDVLDYIYNISVDGINSVYAGFDTSSSDTTLPNGNGFYSIPGLDQTYEGGFDAMVVKLSSVTAGVTVTQTSGATTIAEGGATDTYSLVLNSLPTSNVTVNITPNGEQTTNVGSRVFTPLNWDVPQSVTVTAVNDGDAECIHPGLISHAVVSSDLNYSGLSVSSVVPQITDNEPCTAGVTIAESGGSTDVVEGGATDTYTVVLDFAPYQNVAITASPNSEVTVSPSVLLFNTGNWNTPQVVTVTAVSDGVPECAHDGMIVHNGSGSDPNYIGIGIASVTPHLTDVCGPGVMVSQSGGSTKVSEDGPTGDTYTVVLQTQPAADVTVTVGSGAGITRSPDTITFSTANWNVPQTVTVTAVPDADLECGTNTTLAHTASSADATYNGAPVSSVSVDIQDVCKRLEGTNPSALSVAVSQYRFPGDGSAQSAFVARDGIMADSFTGGPLTNLLHGPMLLTDSTHLSDGIATELARVLPSKESPIYILGGSEAVSPEVRDELRIAGFSNLLSIGGSNRRETAARIALYIIQKQGGVDSVFLLEDQLFVDSFGGAAAAGVLDTNGRVRPILITKRGSSTLDPFADTVLGKHTSISSVELIGGTTALSGALDTFIPQRHKHISNVVRTGGSDRFATSVLLSERFFGQPTGIVLANGATNATVSQLFAALLGSSVAADRRIPLLLTKPDGLPEVVSDLIITHADSIGAMVIVGDAGQVGAAIFDQVVSAT